MATYTATKNGQAVSRKSDRDYSHGVIAVYPDGRIELISCHATSAQAQAASMKTDGTASRYRATCNGARFEVCPLTKA